MAQYRKQVLHIALVVWSLCLILLVGYRADASEAALEKVKAAIAGAHYTFGDPKVYKKVKNLKEDFLPRVVEQHVYWQDKEKKRRIRVDYFRVPGLLDKLFKRERFLATKLYIYDNKGWIIYLVWMNRQGEIQRFTKHLPLRRIARNEKKGTDIFKEVYLTHGRDGEITQRIVMQYHVDYRRREATYIRETFNADNSLVDREQGDWDYSDFYDLAP